MAANKSKNAFCCQQCGTVHAKWNGQCSGCLAWNTLVQETISPAVEPRYQNYSGKEPVLAQLSAVTMKEEHRLGTGMDEFDRVLGGGLVAGSVVLLGGDPGIGKSTLLLQTITHLSQSVPVLYVSGEESPEQISLRAHRLNLLNKNIWLLADTRVENILQHCKDMRPKVMVIDSIQTMYTHTLNSTPGSVGQVRESAMQLVHYAKETHTAVFLVGHVTKEGHLAGPRVLEHMVDTVLYFEGEQDHRFRLIRAIKNRFGAVNELGIFAMTEKGLREVNHPSAIFLSRYDQPISGSAITVSKEGNRPLLIEVQALVDDTQGGPPRRLSVGMDAQRLSMLLAILNRHGNVHTHGMDVYINVVGGLNITETAADLAVIMAIVSSLKNKALPAQCISFGELGLGGEIRPISGGQERLKEAKKHGFKYGIIPKANQSSKPLEDFTVFPVSTIQEALSTLRNLQEQEVS